MCFRTPPCDLKTEKLAASTHDMVNPADLRSHKIYQLHAYAQASLNYCSFLFSHTDTSCVSFLDCFASCCSESPPTMKIKTRFGQMEIDADDIVDFPDGLFGLEDCRQWILLADRQSDAIVWLQSLDRPEFALPLASPRRFVPGYQMRVARRELAPLKLDDTATARVLVIVGRTARGLSLNLKAPLVINLGRRVGRQVITNGELPVRYELGSQHRGVRRSA